MEDREMPRMHKYGGKKKTRIMMATVPHVTAWAGHAKYHADGFLFDWVYNNKLILIDTGNVWLIIQFFLAVFCSLYLILSISGSENKVGWIYLHEVSKQIN